MESFPPVSLHLIMFNTISLLEASRSRKWEGPRWRWLGFLQRFYRIWKKRNLTCFYDVRQHYTFSNDNISTRFETPHVITVKHWGLHVTVHTLSAKHFVQGTLKENVQSSEKHFCSLNCSLTTFLRFPFLLSFTTWQGFFVGRWTLWNARQNTGHLVLRKYNYEWLRCFWWCWGFNWILLHVMVPRGIVAVAIWH